MVDENGSPPDSRSTTPPVDHQSSEQRLTVQHLSGLPKADVDEVVRRLPNVYRELRAAAASCLQTFPRTGTYAATELVHEAWLKLHRCASDREWTSDGHFVAAAAIAMRQIVIDRIRTKRRQKRGGDRQPVSLAECESPVDEERTLMIGELLSTLAQHHPRCARLVEVRFFLGLSESQCADALGVSVRTVRRDWVLARSWLARAIDEQGSQDS